MNVLKNAVSVMLLLFVVTFSVTAQQEGKKDHNPEKRAARETAQLVEKLELDEGQAAKVEAINMDFATKMHEAHESNEGDREAMKEIKDRLHTEKNEAMKLILTEAQFTEYEAMQAERGQGKRKGRKEKGAKEK